MVDKIPNEADDNEPPPEQSDSPSLSPIERRRNKYLKSKKQESAKPENPISSILKPVITLLSIIASIITISQCLGPYLTTLTPTSTPTSTPTFTPTPTPTYTPSPTYTATPVPPTATSTPTNIPIISTEMVFSTLTVPNPDGTVTSGSASDTSACFIVVAVFVIGYFVITEWIEGKRKKFYNRVFRLLKERSIVCVHCRSSLEETPSKILWKDVLKFAGSDRYKKYVRLGGATKEHLQNHIDKYHHTDEDTVQEIQERHILYRPSWWWEVLDGIVDALPLAVIAMIVIGISLLIFYS